jgi:methyl-accepting chemotaxis protein
MKWFSNLKIKVKLVVCFIIVAIFTGIVGFIGISNMKTQNKNAQLVFNNNFIPSQQLAKIQKNLLLIRSDYLLMMYEKNASKLQLRIDEINKLTAENDKLFSSYEAAIASQNERDLWNTLNIDNKTYISLRSEGINLVRDGKFVEVEATLAEVTKAREKVDNDLEQLISLNQKIAEDTNKQNDKAYKTQSTIMLFVIMAAVLLAIALGLVIANILGKPINNLVSAADKIAAGDLDISIDIDTRDEIGILASSFIKMANNTNDIMNNINNAANQVASGAKQVSDSSMALSQGATE